MFWVLLGLSLILIVVAALLWRRLRGLNTMIETLRQDQQQLAQAWNALPPDARALLPADKALLSVEILNPQQLASQESRFADALGSVTPGLLRRIVYQRTAEILRGELAAKGVQAEVRLHGLG
ncbi:MAG TPA: hypothetical protein VGE57_11130 [Solimonas sp.]